MSQTDRYFDFLQYSVTPDTALPASVNDMDWQGLFLFGKEQALLGVLFEGVKRLPKGTIKDIGLLAKWTVIASRIEQQNKRLYCCCDTASRMYEAKGFRNMVLKGQGAALRYPNIFSRTPGDIDLFLEGGADTVLPFVWKEYGRDAEFNMHHVDAPPVDGISVEAHFRCANLRNPFNNKRLQAWLDNHLEAQLLNTQRVDVDGHDVSFCCPTVTYNLVYELVHIYSHVMFEGIGMRQIVDYYMLLRQPSAKDAVAVIDKELRRFGLVGIAGAVMWVLEKTLRLERDLMIAGPDERRGRFLYQMIVDGGNFGRNATFTRAMRNGGRLETYLLRLCRSLRLAVYFPGEALWDAPFRARLKGWKMQKARELKHLNL